MKKASQLKVRESRELRNFDTAFSSLEYLVLISNVTNAAFMQEGKARDYYDDCCSAAYDLPNADVHLVRFDHATDKSTTMARFGIYHDHHWK